MTLGRLVLAWLVLAAWFYAATWLTALIRLFTMRLPPGAGWFISISAWAVRWRPIEAAILTLLASLWFDSLGGGGWWLVFALIGLLATIPPLFLESTNGASARARLLVGALAEVLRYVVGGALLAWRLA